MSLDEWTSGLRALGLGGWATREQIQAAYRRLARAFHPDVNRGAGAERFREAAEAYRTLEELWRMKEAGESRDLFQAVLLDPLFARIGTGRLKLRLRCCPLWQVRASAAAALGLRGEERIDEALAEARRDPDARVREAARRVLAQLRGTADFGGRLRQWARGIVEPAGAPARAGGY
jgi:curved DNA-binding protein CbpA